MKRLFLKYSLTTLSFLFLCCSTVSAAAQEFEEEGESFHQILKEKFIEGNALFMSLVALALIIGLTFCIERIIYLTLADIHTRRFIGELEKKVESGDLEAAKKFCADTRGPVASICVQGLIHIDDKTEDIERYVNAYADVQVGTLERGCSWITLFIALAPSLGFLGTVIGMVMSFDSIEMAGDISPTLVAGGMKVALITTIFGIVVAVILQVFYNYILSRIEHLTSQMEQASIDLMDIIVKYKSNKN